VARQTIDTDRELRLRAIQLMVEEPPTLQGFQRNIYAARRIAGGIQRVRVKNDTLAAINFYIGFFSSTELDQYSAIRASTYIGTMLAPKRDFLGRMILVDARFFDDMTNLMWSGNNELWLGQGYFEPSPNQRFESYDDEHFARSHTPSGVKLEGAGLGTVLYSSMALASTLYEGLDGVWSPRIRVTKRDAEGGIYRSEKATKWWTQQVKRGYAMETTISDNGRPIDYLQTSHVVSSGLLVFGAMSEGRQHLDEGFPLGANNDPNWASRKSGSFRLGDSALFKAMSLGDDSWLDDRAWEGTISGIYDEYGGFSHSPETLEMLPRAYHANRPLLAAVILDVLSRQDESRAVEYATRADIAKMLAGNQNATRLVQRAATPGLSGLSGYAHREVMHAISAASLSQGVQIDDIENPLHFTPLSKRTESLLAKLDDES
jgi:hypothetical protein